MPTPARLSPEERVDRAYRLMEERFDRVVSGHPFMRQLGAGTLPRETLQGFVVSWYGYTRSNTTYVGEAYRRFKAFYKLHSDVEAVVADRIGDRLMHPTRGGHPRTLETLGLALGIARDDLIRARLSFEARVIQDFAVRLWVEGTFVEMWAGQCFEGKFNDWSQRIRSALTSRYGVKPEQVGFFNLDHDAPVIRTEDGGLLSRSEADRWLIRRGLELGLDDETPGLGIEYCAVLPCENLRLLLDGVLKHYQAGPAFDLVHPVLTKYETYQTFKATA